MVFLFNMIFAWLMFQYFFIKIYYCVGEPPLPAYPHLHTTVGLLNANFFQISKSHTEFGLHLLSSSRKSRRLKRFEIAWEIWICIIDKMVFIKIWSNLKELQKSVKNTYFSQLLCLMKNGMKGILVKSASLQTNTHTCVS